MVSTQLGQILAADFDGTWGEAALEDSGTPVVRSTEMRGGRLDLATAALREIPPSTVRKKALTAGDILVNKSSGSQHLVGASVLFDYVGEQTYLCSNFIRCLRPNHELVDSEFLYWALQSPQFRDQVFGAQRTTSGLRNLKIEEYKAASLYVPGKPEQRRIVARIKECMDRIDEIEKLSETSAPEVKALSRSFYREQYERLCADFGVCRLDRAAKFTGGGTPSKQNPSYWKGTIPWISPKDMKRRDLHDASDHISDAAISGSSAKLITESSVLFVVRGMILAHTLPIAVNRVPVAINQDMKAAVPGEGFDADFLATMLRGAEKTLLAEVEIAGHGTCRLQQPHWSGVSIPVLSPVEQADVVAATQAFESIADRLSSEVTLNERGAMRAAVLHKAFAGEM